MAQSRMGVRGTAWNMEARAHLGHAHMEVGWCRVSEPEKGKEGIPIRGQPNMGNLK